MTYFEHHNHITQAAPDHTTMVYKVAFFLQIGSTNTQKSLVKYRNIFYQGKKKTHKSNVHPWNMPALINHNRYYKEKETKMYIHRREVLKFPIFHSHLTRMGC